MSSYSSLKIELIDTGQQAGTWGATTNTNLGTAIEEAIVGSADVTFASSDVTLTLTNTNATQEARHLRLNLVGTSGGARNLILGNGCQIDKPYLINNGLADTVTVKNTSGTGVAVPAGKSMWVFNNGTNVVDAVTHLSSLTLGSSLPVASGGTGQTSYTDGQLLIGNSSGNTLTKSTLTAGSGITITNGSGAITIAATGGAGSGTVTSVSGTGTVNGITLSGTVTSSGSLTLGGAISNVDLSSAVSNVLPVANGGTGQSGYTNGQLLIGNSTGNTLTKATLTAGSGVTITNGAGSITIAATGGGTGTVTSVSGTGTVNGITLTGTVTSSGSLTLGGTLTGVDLTSAVTGTLPVANGGTGITSFGTGIATWLGTPSSANLRSAVTDETGSGSLVFATSPTLTSPTLVTPALGTPASGTLSSCTVDGTDAVGFRNTPINSKSAAYTLVLTDSGKTILHPSSDNNARTFTIPANSSVAFPIGTVITFVNMINTVTIAITSDTMTAIGTGSTGSRTLAANGSATAMKISSTAWVISGVNLT